MVRPDRPAEHRGPWPTRALALGLSLAILAALASRMQVEEVAEALRSVGPWPWVVTLLVALLDGLVIDADKLRLLLRHLGFPASFRDAAALAIPATALGALAPAQVEEFWKARQVQVRLGTSFPEALGIVAFERGLNLVSHLVLAAAGLVSLALDPSFGWTLWLVLGGAYAAGLGGISLVSRVLRSGRLDRHAGAVAFLSALRRTSTGFRAGLLAYACLANLALSGCLWWMAIGAGVEWPLASALAWRAAAVVGSKVPVSLGGLGIREGVLVLGLSGSAEASLAVTVALLFGLTTSLAPPLFALGFWSGLRETTGWMIRDLGRGLRCWRSCRSKPQDPR